MSHQNPSPCGIVAILTDFGLHDPYVAAMKAVAIDICPSIRIIDITHLIDSFDVETAAFTLYIAYKYFPRGTVFVAVVDPGVGSKRNALALVTRNYIFIGPDNGLLVPAAEDDGIVKAYLIENEKYFRKPVSKSFHGRDIFMPVAAHISCGVDLQDLGRPIDIDKLVRVDIGIGYLEKENNCIKLKVVHIDKFGNVILSIPFTELKQILGIDIGSKVKVCVNHRESLARVEEVFSTAPKGALILYENSFGLAELAVNQGSAKDLLDVEKKHHILICI